MHTSRAVLPVTLMVLLALLATTAASASTIAYVSGPVPTLDGETCSIGNVIFSFGNATIRNDGNIAGLTPASITLTVDPVDNGFLLSGTISDTGPANNVYEDELDWSVDFSTLNGQASATGVTSGFTGSATGNGLGTFTEFNEATINNGAYAQPGFGEAACPIGFNLSGTFACTVDFYNGPVSATAPNGTDLIYGILALNGGTATISSAEYFIAGVQAGSASASTPEPATVFLLGAGIAMLGLSKRRPNA